MEENIITDVEYRKVQERLQRLGDPTYLNTITMSELYDNVYLNKPPLINDLLYPGTYILAGTPKAGKSFLSMQICYHLSVGNPLWIFDKCQKCEVLYLALEDTYQRLQNRLSQMFGVSCTDNLHFAIIASSIGNGLEEQLEGFITNYPNTKLIIIDTLQKVRANVNSKYSYAEDYACIGSLKAFTDSKGICVIIVHHTRKQQDDDCFNMISGTNGILGAADGAFLLCRESRVSKKATLEIIGRDQPEQRLHLIFNSQTLCWDLEKRDMEPWKEPPDPLLDSIAAVISERGAWSGNATELVALLKSDLSANSLTRKLNISASKLWEEYSIRYENKRTAAERKITLTMIN